MLWYSLSGKPSLGFASFDNQPRMVEFIDLKKTARNLTYKTVAYKKICIKLYIYTVIHNYVYIIYVNSFI